LSLYEKYTSALLFITDPFTESDAA